MKKFNFSVLLVSASLIFGCGESDEAGTAGATSGAVQAGPSEDTAEATMLHLMDGLKNGQPVVVWNSLPDSYQKDINGLVQSFGSNMDPDVWKQSIDLITTVHKLLVDKGEFIGNYPMIAEGGNSDAAKKAIPQIAGLLKTVIDGASDLEALKSFDGATFMTTTGASLVGQLDAISSLSPNPTGGPSGLAALSSIKVETIESSADSATLKITGPDGQEKSEEFVKVEGKWLPKEMTVSWTEQIAAAKDALAKLPEQSGAMKGQMMMVSGMAGGMLAPLQSAETQEQFNAAMDGLTQGAMGMFMGGMGGPPADAFGPPMEESEAPTESGSSLGN